MSIYFHDDAVPLIRPLSLRAIAGAALAAIFAGLLLLFSPPPARASQSPDLQAIYGTITISSDAEGRLLIVADKVPFGDADILVSFQGPAPLTFPSQSFRRASLLIERGRVRVVTSRKPALYLDIATAEDPTVPAEQTPERLVVRGGLALVVESVPPDTTLAAALSHGGGKPILEDGDEGASLLAEKCLAGGPGARSCSYKCSSSVGSSVLLNVERATECSADCGVLSYACCGCGRWTREASCLCIKENIKSTLPKCHTDLGN